MEEFRRALQQAEELDASGNPFYMIDASRAFVSCHTAPTIIAEEDTMVPTPTPRLPLRGDVLLRVFCDKGTVRLRWTGYSYPLFEAQDIILFNGNGFPAQNCQACIYYTTSDPTARVFTEWEIYAGKQHRDLGLYRHPLDAERGVCVTDGRRVFDCVGVNEPLSATCTIYQVSPKQRLPS